MNTLPYHSSQSFHSTVNYKYSLQRRCSQSMAG
uniref:Uncharacterized protein n=1 Tax=Anguilla anguilla TaxID=7936 RepID=A0A0E9V7Q9_ANGAN